MTIEQIKTEVQGMSEAEQNHLAAFLAHLRHLRDKATRATITERNADRDPSHWVSPGELRKRWES